MQYLVKFGSNAAVGHGDPDMLVVEHVFILVERTGLEGGARDALAHLFARDLRCFLGVLRQTCRRPERVHLRLQGDELDDRVALLFILEIPDLPGMLVGWAAEMTWVIGRNLAKVKHRPQ